MKELLLVKAKLTPSGKNVILSVINNIHRTTTPVRLELNKDVLTTATDYFKKTDFTILGKTKSDWDELIFSIKEIAPLIPEIDTPFGKALQKAYIHGSKEVWNNPKFENKDFSDKRDFAFAIGQTYKNEVLDLNKELTEEDRSQIFLIAF